MSRGPRRSGRTPALRWLRAFVIAAACLLGVVCAPTGASAVTGSWSDRLADLTGAAQLAGGGRGVTVAVLDTWVDTSHPEFGGRALAGVTCTDGHCNGVGNKPDACDPHGTHVSGIVAATRYGVAPQAKVLPVRVLTARSGSCTAHAGDVALGIRYAMQHHVRVINVSLGSTFPLDDPNGVLQAAVTAATKAGSLVVVAAGNGQAAGVNTYGKNALTVAALSATGQIASYSQQGPGVDIAAPGGDAPDGNCDPNVCVVSTWQDGGYASDAGTSMAAPFVSGTAALLLSQRPKQSVAELRKTILSTAHPLPGAGAGRLDVLAAVRLHAPASHSSPQTGTDAGIRTGPTSEGVAGASRDSASVTPVPGAGLPPTPSTITTAHPAASSHRAPPSHGVTLGPVQLMGIVVVGGVALAFMAVSGQRRARQQ